MNKKRTTTLAIPALVCAALLAAISQPLIANELSGMQDGNGDFVRLPVFKSRVIQLDRPARRVSIGSPDIADILILRSSQLYILGKDIGTTNVLLWDNRDQLIRAINVEVTHDLEGLKALLHQLLPGENIEVRSALRSLVLSGQVSSLGRMESALRIAESFLQQIATAKTKQTFEQSPAGGKDKVAGKIINMMTVTGNHQVMLEVKVAEIARTVLKRFQMNFNAIDNGSSTRWIMGGASGGANFPDAEFDPGSLRIPIFGDGSGEHGVVGPAIDEFRPNDLSISESGLFASFLTENFLLNVVLDAAKEKGLARILAEPTLTTQSGKQAEFLSGGEFPIPVPQGLDTITITFKEFGVGLKFLPVVLDKDLINLQLSVSVSDLVSADAVTFQPSLVSQGFFIPALRKRSANTTVELSDGQTIGIAGLLNEDLREVINKFPGLGDIPVIGHLFRSQEFIKGETELVILVTPHLAKPLPPGPIELPTDNFVEPSDFEFYLMGRMEARSPAMATTRDHNDDGQDGAEGNFGHSIPEGY
ncbi:MAG: type II and III secretion system protein family protein [Gammaproteobacteria bacterium]|nr:type II and III secretion system protein family protein [Gammaproteobacteria bacterium]NNF59866.1 type II and III secretion system protein family protein [Gammaproteobacteria bacterium]NNM21493.1 type II and III secretion system protein family protein [Gammaproteobacteria bacterium]